jgi:hypothetical protein
VDVEEMVREFERLSEPAQEKFLRNLHHVSFPFKITPSYLKYGNHPLTIRKEVYGFMRLHGVPIGDDLTVSFPDGSTAIGYIYRGTAGWGEFYQIKLRHPFTGTGPGISQFKNGDLIRVDIVKSENRTEIRFSRQK